MAPAQKVGCDLKRLCYGALLLATAGALRAETFYLTIAGLGGEAEYEQRFSGWAKDIDKLLHTAEPNSKIVTLLGADATKTNIDSHLRDIAKQAKADDTVVVMLIGHGGYDDIEYKF